MLLFDLKWQLFPFFNPPIILSGFPCGFIGALMGANGTSQMLFEYPPGGNNYILIGQSVRFPFPLNPRAIAASIDRLRRGVPVK